MSDQFLEQWINIKFCVILGKNASDTCAVLSVVYWGEGEKLWKIHSDSEWQKPFKESRENMGDGEK